MVLVVVVGMDRSLAPRASDACPPENVSERATVPN